MTPTLRAVYDELMRLSAVPPAEERAAALRQDFFRRTGGPPPADGGEDGELSARFAAAWDDALTRGGLAREVAQGLPDPSERALARVLSRAHRGLFQQSELEGRHLVHDLTSGAVFLLIPRDDVGRGLRATGTDGPLFDGRVVAAADGAAILPGVVFHPPDASPLIEKVVATGRSRGMVPEDICDALLRMESTFRRLSRVKIAYAYKAEALAPRLATREPGAPFH